MFIYRGRYYEIIFSMAGAAEPTRESSLRESGGEEELSRSWLQQREACCKANGTQKASSSHFKHSTNNKGTKTPFDWGETKSSEMCKSTKEKFENFLNQRNVSKLYTYQTISTIALIFLLVGSFLPVLSFIAEVSGILYAFWTISGSTLRIFGACTISVVPSDELDIIHIFFNEPYPFSSGSYLSCNWFNSVWSSYFRLFMFGFKF